MATNRNIQMNYFNGIDYDVLNPRTTVGNISDWNSAIYSKSEVDSKINTVNSKVGDLKITFSYIANCVFNISANASVVYVNAPFNLSKEISGYNGFYIEFN